MSAEGRTIDCGNVATVAEFWSQLLGLSMLESPLPERLCPGWSCFDLPARRRPKAGQSRVHLDLGTDDPQSAVDKVRCLGGGYSGKAHVYGEAAVAVMADPRY